MSETILYGDEAPTMEVRVFRDGRIVHRELCESEEQAALVVKTWSELEGVECEVEDLSARHGPDDILASEAAEVAVEDEYPADRDPDV